MTACHPFSLGLRMMFSGLMSRWMIPIDCISATAAQDADPRPCRVLDREPRALQDVREELASMYSMTSAIPNGGPVRNSYIRAMCGGSEGARGPRLHGGSARRSPRDRSLGWSTLIATRSLVSLR